MLPADIKASLDRYAMNMIPPGGFLSACLANDFVLACGRADDANALCLVDIARYIHCALPRECHGSEEAVREWCKRRVAT